MPYPTLRSLAPAVAAMIAAAAPLSAETTESRLNMAGELNVLVHRAAASACMISAGVAVEDEKLVLATARTTFNETLDALRTDNMAEDIARIDASWKPLDGAMSMILAGDDPAIYADTLEDGQGALEFATLQLLDRTSNEYEHADGVTMSDVLTVDLAERQEVFVQQIKHLACQMAANEVSTDLIEELATKSRLFESTLTALRDGMPEIGVQPSDNFEVNQVLAVAGYDWQRVKPHLDQIAVNGAATAKDLVTLRAMTEILEARMDLLVDYYLAVPAEASPDPLVAALTVDAD